MSPEKRSKLVDKIYSEGDKYGIYPLTYDQYLLWCGFIAEINKVHYTNPGIIVNMKNIPHDKCLQIIEQLRKLQDTFRYKYTQINEYVFQYIDNDSPYSVIEKDISGYQDKEAYIKKYIKEFYTLPIDISTDFPVIFELIKISESEYSMLICMHHIISDSLSAGAVYKDICSVIEGRAVKSCYQFGRYALEKNSPSGIKTENDNAQYWVSQINDAAKFTDIPTDYSRLSDGSETSKTITGEIAGDCYKYLKEKAQKERGSLYNIIVSLFSIVLQEYSMKNNVIIGTSFFNRNDENLSQLVGDFATVVPYVFRGQKEITLNEYFRENMKNFKSAMEHCDVTITNIQQAYPWDRTKIYFPLYQIIFLYESLNILGGSKNNVNGVELELSNLTDEDRQDQFKMDMFIEAIDMGTKCVIKANYSEKLFKRVTIENLMKVYIGFINNLKVYEDQLLTRLSIADEKQFDDILPENSYSFDNIEKTDISVDERFVIKITDCSICILNDNLLPVPVNFYGNIYKQYENEWYYTGKTGKISPEGKIQINEAKSDVIMIKSQRVDLRYAKKILKKNYEGLDFNFRYISEDRLVLNYSGAAEKFPDYCCVYKLCGFIPTLIYHTEHYDKMYIIRHQNNIIRALDIIESSGFSALALQHGYFETDIVICADKNVITEKMICEIYDQTKDNSIILKYTSVSFDIVLRNEYSESDLQRLSKIKLNPDIDELVYLWSSVVEHDKFGIYDDFFEIGGNSIRIVKLCSQINQCFGINISIADLYANSTIFDQAEFISKNKVLRCQ